MATYVIGDVQGCYDCLCRLLEKIQFNEHQDRLWLVGDLINRGPKSVAVLRFIRSLGQSAATVLGNHDLGLLVHWQHPTLLKETSQLDEIIAAPDSDELLHWLRQQPLLLEDKSKKVLVTHAGIYPLWSLETAIACANELSQALCSDDFKQILGYLWGNQPYHWADVHTDEQRLRFTCNALTRMRYVFVNGALNLRDKGASPILNADCFAWFLHPNLQLKDYRIIFGHWAGLDGICSHPQIEAIDTGCVWGRKLTAFRVEDTQRFAIECQGFEQ